MYKLLARTFWRLPAQKRDQVVAVEMHAVRPVAGLVTRKQLLLDVGSAGCGQNGGKPVEVRDDFVRDRTGLDLAWPTDQRGHAKTAFPIGILLAAKWRGGRIGPGVGVGPIVGAVHHQRVVRHAEIIDLLQDGAHVAVVIDHHVVVRALPLAGLSAALGLRIGAEMHVGEVHPDKHRLAAAVLFLNEISGASGDVVVNCLHPLLG